MTSLRAHGLLGDRDPTEIQDEHDRASVQEQEFLQISLLEQQCRAQADAAKVRGICGFCQAVCLPLAVYCDADCRDGHELELAAAARRGRAG